MLGRWDLYHGVLGQHIYYFEFKIIVLNSLLQKKWILGIIQPQLSWLLGLSLLYTILQSTLHGPLKQGSLQLLSCERMLPHRLSITDVTGSSFEYLDVLQKGRVQLHKHEALNSTKPEHDLEWGLYGLLLVACNTNPYPFNHGINLCMCSPYRHWCCESI